MNGMLMLMAVSMTVVILVVGVGLAATPWIVRGTECFAVTIPASAVRDPRLRVLKRRYAAIVLALTAAFTLASLACLAAGVWGSIGFIITTAGSLALCVVPFLLMLVFRRRVRAIKEAEGWRAVRQVRMAAFGERELPRPLPLAWEFLHLPLAGIAAALAIALLPAMPERVPVHFNAAGAVDGWMDKGLGVVLLPAGIILFMGACMTFSHISIVKAKRWSSPDAPAASAYGYALYARAQSMLVVALGIMLDVGFCLLPLNMAGIVPIEVVTGAMLLTIAVSVIACVWIYAVYGQNGCRAAGRLAERAEAGGMQVDEDSLWKLGVFYVNRDDAAIFVPKRFGVGWSMNWGRPATWGIIVGFAALVAAFMMGMNVLVG